MTGTDGDEDRIRDNLARMEAMALPVYERGHLAVVAEWLSWPVIAQAGGTDHASPQFAERGDRWRVADRDQFARLYPQAGPGLLAQADLVAVQQFGRTVHDPRDDFPVARSDQNLGAGCEAFRSAHVAIGPHIGGRLMLAGRKTDAPCPHAMGCMLPAGNDECRPLCGRNHRVTAHGGTRHLGQRGSRGRRSSASRKVLSLAESLRKPEQGWLRPLRNSALETGANQSY